MTSQYQRQPVGQANGFEIIAQSSTHLTVCVPDGRAVIVRGIHYSARIQCHFWAGAWHVGEQPEPGQNSAILRYNATYVRREDWLQKNLKSSEASYAATEKIREMALVAARQFAWGQPEVLRLADEIERNDRAWRKRREIDEMRTKLDTLVSELLAIEAER